MTLHDRARAARSQLAAAGITGDEAARDADLLARHVLGCDLATWLQRRAEAPPAGFDAAYAAIIERRARREPVAYIRGRQEFWGRDFVVGPGVLIPRPETEFIVEEALAWAAAERPGGVLRVLDIGTGSGCLAVTLAIELADAEVEATDISAEALAVARENARRLGARVTFHHGSLASGVTGAFDVLVSNPPYIPEGDMAGLQPEVGVYEPRSALAGGLDGLDIVRQVIAEGARRLAAGGRLLVELGAGQADTVAAIVADTEGLGLLRIRRDLQGVARTLVAERRPVPATCSE